jgi:hypothetical protein
MRVVTDPEFAACEFLNLVEVYKRNGTILLDKI